MKELKKLTPFKYFALTNFPYIEADFDALTNYELYSKICEYINKVAENNNNQIDNFNELYATWLETKEYIDNYFENLDVDEEINTKLDNMANSGELTALLQPFASSVITEWLNNNISGSDTVVIDKTLSVEDACADAFYTGKIKHAVFEHNEYEVLENYANFIDETDNRGTVITWNGNTATCTNEGTTTGTGISSCFIGGAVYNIGVPAPFKKGHRYAIKVTASDEHLRCQFLNWTAPNVFTYVTLNSNGVFVISPDATGIGIRLNISAGFTGTGTIKVEIYEQCDIKCINGMNNDVATAEYSNTLANLPLNSYTWFNNNWFTDKPNNLDSNENSGVIFTLTRDLVNQSNNSTIQVIFYPVLGACYIRRIDGLSTPTKWVEFGNYFKSYPKYVAFGDSLMWGSVWTEEGGEAVINRTSWENRMPSRIAHAVGSDTTFQNLAVGGMAFVPHEGTYATSFYDYITAQDLTGVKLITLGGGRNDAPTPLGNGDTPTTPDTICYEVNRILNYLTTNYKKCQIVFTQVTPSTSNNANVFVGVTSGGWSLNSYETEVSKVCDKYGVPFINWKNCQYIYHWADYTGAGGNTAHPNNDEAYIQMGNYLAGRVSEYYKG